MSALALWPWIAGPLVAGGGLIPMVSHMTSFGVAGEFLVEGVRRFGTPVLVAVPGSVAVLAVALTRFLRKDLRRSDCPFEVAAAFPASPEPEPEARLVAGLAPRLVAEPPSLSVVGPLSTFGPPENRTGERNDPKEAP